MLPAACSMRPSVRRNSGLMTLMAGMLMLAYALSLANIGDTDHVSFHEIGLSGFEFIRDYMEGNNTRAPHTNMDTSDHLLEDDLKQSVAVAASFIYNLAVRDERLPRKPLPSH